MPAGKRRVWPLSGGGKSTIGRRVFGHANARAGARIMGSNKMAKRKKSVEDVVITKARTHAEQMLSRLVEIASAEPPTHVSIKAAETIIALAREKTDDERNPFGIEWPG
jgi:ABC-type dipeptide/oligopeptide/nickel transport system ATPase subunit